MDYANDSESGVITQLRKDNNVKKLDIVYASDLPDEYTPPDELIEGILIAGDASVVYGDSNTGKTYLVIDMAGAVDRGIDWFGRKTEQGIVLYLAAESPSSVQRRLQAYQKHHNVKLDNFIIVRNPIDLYNSDEDANAIINLVDEVEAITGKKVRLIVGDTLARLTAGANESSGQDMGVVIKHIDYVRAKCDAHFMLVHHSGKNAAAGQRGWSGVRGAIDTEIEVTDSLEGRCAEITKQRDLDTKGERIGFSLEPVIMGKSKWGKDVTSCVVQSADAPKKKTTKRLGEVEGKIMEYVYSQNKLGTNHFKKSEIVSHLEDRHHKGTVYNSITKLIESKMLAFANGFLNSAE